ncbi:hypothetical protein MKX08_004468 [Trichoderma sp. CBMAI-0020]|nr:hypothetical protein MKX08_004468 [Trichoderma sp. CBMAI-0020]
MAARITYDGVPSTVGGGNIFQGMKFWVSRLVPSRDWIIDQIQTNSGTVVVQEKDADMLIADHARKDVPLGSYSWKYITESVKAGFVQVEDKYLNGPPPGQPRPILAGSRAKKTRTPFSEQDDAILAKHVLQKGIDTAGNKMYMELEALYPHHTYQSWRHRWVKILSLRSNHDIDRPAPREPTRRQQTTPSENLDRKSTTTEVASEQNGDGTENDSTPYHDAPTGEEQAQERIDNSEADSEGGQEEKSKENAEEDVGEENMEDGEGDSAEDDTGVDSILPSFTERDQFHSDLQDYCEANGRELQKQCVIRDKKIDLWDLFQAVKTQNLPLEEVDWKRVARYVGFDRAQSKEIIATLLQTSYHRHLAGFVEAMLSFEDDLEEDSEEDEEIIPQTGEAAAEPTTPSRNGSGSAKATKRLSDAQSRTPEPRSKRRRTIGATIPVTPEAREKTKRRQSAPAPGQLGHIVDDGRIQTDNSPHGSIPMRDRQRQWSPEEPDNTPSQQLQNESNSVASPEHGDKETPSRHKQLRSSGYQFNDRELETIMEEEPSASTPTKPKSKKRSLPLSFQQPQTIPPHERRRLVEQEQHQEEGTQEAQAPEEQQQGEDENWKTKEFHKWTKHYREAGYSDDLISEAMYRTSWVPGARMEQVLKSLQKGDDIPNNVQGIWTYRDDAKLDYVSQFESLDPVAGDTSETQRRRAKAARMLEQLLYKHTKSGVDLRSEIHEEIAKQGGKKMRKIG